MINYVHVRKMTDEEKLKMYLDEPKEKIARMLIKCNKLLDQLQQPIVTTKDICENCGKPFDLGKDTDAITCDCKNYPMGWKCPECGLVINPFETTCPNSPHVKYVVSDTPKEI